MSWLATTAIAEALRRNWKSIRKWIKAGGRSKKRNWDKTLQPYLEQARACIKKTTGLVDKAENGTKLDLVNGKHIRQGGHDEWVFNYQGLPALGLAIYGTPIIVMLGSDGNGRFSISTAVHECGHVVLMPHGEYGHPRQYRVCFDGWSDSGRRAPYFGEGSEDMVICCVDLADGDSITLCMTHEEMDISLAQLHIDNDIMMA